MWDRCSATELLIDIERAQEDSNPYLEIRNLVSLILWTMGAWYPLIVLTDRPLPCHGSALPLS